MRCPRAPAVTVVETRDGHVVGVGRGRRRRHASTRCPTRTPTASSWGPSPANPTPSPPSTGRSPRAGAHPGRHGVAVRTRSWWCTGSTADGGGGLSPDPGRARGGGRGVGARGGGRARRGPGGAGDRARRAAGGPPVVPARPAARPGGLADRRCRPAGWPGRARWCRPRSPSAATTPGCAPTRRWSVPGAESRLLAAVLRRRPPDARLPHRPAPSGAQDPVGPALQGRGRQLGPLRVQRPDPGREGRSRAPTPCRPTATWSCTRGPTPTRCPTWRSRTTTSAAATPPPSGRSPRISASTWRAGACRPTSPTG